MLKYLLITFFLFIAVYGMSQDHPQIPEGYQVDTLLRPSAENPEVLDTVIVYKKINIIHREVVIRDTNTAKARSYLMAGVSAGLFFPTNGTLPSYTTDTESLSDKWTALDASVALKRNNWLFGNSLGVSRLTQQYRHKYNQQVVTEESVVVKDTVDVYYVENNDGEQDPHYVIKENTITSFDTSTASQTYQFRNSLTYINYGLHLGYEVELGRWVFSPVIGYALAIPIKSKGSVVTADNNLAPLHSGQVSPVINIISFKARFAYLISSATRIFMSTNFTQHLNPVYKNPDKSYYRSMGVQAGVLFCFSKPDVL